MNRKDAIQKIVKNELKDISDSSRKEIIECLFIADYEIGDPEIGCFPKELQQEICSGVEPSNPMNKKYEPILLDELERNYIGVKNEYILQKLQALGVLVSGIEGDAEKLEKCPCCGYLSLSERGAYDICSVCFWEDDGASKDNDYSGPNHITLGEGRSNFQKYGACDKESKKFVDLDGTNKFDREHT